jgi:ABC-2 type transport system permease protein
MIRALRAEWGKTFSILSPLLCLISTVVLVAATAASLGNDFVHGLGIGEHPAGATMRVVDALSPAVQFGLLTFTAAAMTLITSEYSTGSIRSTFQAQPRRSVVLAGKTLVAAALGVVSGAVAGVLGVAAGSLMLAEHTAPSAEAPVVTVARVAVLFVALGAIIRSAVGTLAVGLVLLVGMLALPPSMSVWTPAGAAGRFVTADDADYPAAVGLLIVAGWAAAAYAAASVLLERRDA